MKKSNRKRGFPLVELIVVLVILAILAALLVPALTGYIDKARKSQVIAETRMIVQAVQTEVVELYPTEEYKKQVAYQNLYTIASKDGNTVLNGNDKQIITKLEERYKAILNLAEVPGLSEGKGHFTSIVDLSGKVYLVIYNDGKGYLGIYFADKGEYLALKCENDVSDDNYISYWNKVVGSDANLAMWSRDYVLWALGYQGAPST